MESPQISIIANTEQMFDFQIGQNITLIIKGKKYKGFL